MKDNQATRVLARDPSTDSWGRENIVHLVAEEDGLLFARCSPRSRYPHENAKLSAGKWIVREHRAGDIFCAHCKSNKKQTVLPLIFGDTLDESN